MPDAGPKSDIEQSVGNDPHVGTDHGFVEWVRVVKGQGSLLAVPLSSSLSSSFEAWRPIMESSCGNAIWEWNVHSGAWNADWQQTTQWPYLYRADWLNGTGMWPDPKTPFPGRHGHDSVPVTDSEGLSQPWNKPSTRILAAGETLELALHFLPVPNGPRALERRRWRRPVKPLREPSQDTFWLRN